MNKKITATLCVLAVTILFAASNIGILNARETQPGSNSDPVVTKSYVDKVIKDIKVTGGAGGYTNEILEAQEEMIELLNTELNVLKEDVIRLESEGTGDNTYKVVDVEPGEKLIGRQGTEIILRAGEGRAIRAELGGLQDVTDGVDITEGLVPKYHLLITPRDDKRGVLVTKKATFMVRGGYTIE